MVRVPTRLQLTQLEAETLAANPALGGGPPVLCRFREAAGPVMPREPSGYFRGSYDPAVSLAQGGGRA